MADTPTALLSDLHLLVKHANEKNRTRTAEIAQSAADRIATLEAALRVITMLEIGTPLQDARIICRKALEEPSDDDSLPPGLVAELGLIPPWKPGDDGEFV
jgi:hypothetical protein